MGANRRRFPAPMPRLDSERPVAEALAAGGPAHQARLVCPVIRRGRSARSLGTGPLVAAAGAPMAGPASPPLRPAHPGRGMRRCWSAPGTRNAQCPSIRIRVSQWNHLAPEHLNPGWRANGLFSQRYRHDRSHFHSDASAFTSMPHFASVITLAKWRYPFENSTSLAKQPPVPAPRARPRKDTFRPGLAKQPERPTRVRDFPLKARHHPQNSPSNPDHGRLTR